MLKSYFRATTALLIAPIMRATGFRFSKDYRHGTTRFHRIVYALVNTVSANFAAGMPHIDEDRIVRVSPFKYL